MSKKTINIVSICLGMVDFGPVVDSSILSVPRILMPYIDYSFSLAYGDERDMQYTFFSGIINALVLAIDTNDWYTVAEILTGKAYRDWENDDKYSTPYENYIGDESYRVNNELLNT